jgi:hypothetical protein
MLGSALRFEGQVYYPLVLRVASATLRACRQPISIYDLLFIIYDFRFGIEF